MAVRRSITRHRYVRTQFPWLKRCQYCKLMKLVLSGGEIGYKFLNEEPGPEEPKCITRTVNAPASDKAE